jgi:hypothetical protein
MQEPFDWELAFEATMRSAMAASQNSENAVAGMAKLLREIDQNSRRISKVSSTITDLETALNFQTELLKAQRNQPQAASPHSLRNLALGLCVAFAVGATCGGFIVS